MSEYWTYDGSLTTAPYDDCVEWIVLKNPIEVSNEQLNDMRHLVCFRHGENVHYNNMGLLIENFRPVQEKTNSKVRASFRPRFDALL